VPQHRDLSSEGSALTTTEATWLPPSGRITVAGQRRNLTGLRSLLEPGTDPGAWPKHSPGWLLIDVAGQIGDQPRQSQGQRFATPFGGMVKLRPQRVAMDGRRDGRHTLFNGHLVRPPSTEKGYLVAMKRILTLGIAAALAVFAVVKLRPDRPLPEGPDGSWELTDDEPPK